MEIEEYFQYTSICHFSRYSDLIKIDFMSADKIVCLHIQCSLLRVLQGNAVLVSSNDMYLPGKQYKKKLFRKFEWDIPGKSLYDDQMLEHGEDLLNKKVQSACFLGKDLFIYLENDYKIEVIDSTLEKEHELFRVFIKGDLDSHKVVET